MTMTSQWWPLCVAPKHPERQCKNPPCVHGRQGPWLLPIERKAQRHRWSPTGDHRSSIRHKPAQHQAVEMSRRTKLFTPRYTREPTLELSRQLLKHSRRIPGLCSMSDKWTAVINRVHPRRQWGNGFRRVALFLFIGTNHSEKAKFQFLNVQSYYRKLLMGLQGTNIYDNAI